MSGVVRWVFDGTVSGRSLFPDLANLMTGFYLHRIFWAFEGRRIRITIEELDPEEVIER